MAAVEVTISGVLFDKLNRTTQQVVLIGEATLTGVGVGGGPIYPPSEKPPGERPPGIWGPPGPWPTPPIHLPPGSDRPPGTWGGAGEPFPTPPIVIPLPPNTPNVPPPGSPPVIIGGTSPVNPITPPAAIVVEYPGIGKVVVPQPTQTASGPVAT